MVSRGPRARAPVIYRRCYHGVECSRCYIPDGHPARPRPAAQTVKPVTTPDTFAGDARATYGGRPRSPPPEVRGGPAPALRQPWSVSGLPVRSRSGTGALDPGGAMPVRPSWWRARTGAARRRHAAAPRRRVRGMPVHVPEGGAARAAQHGRPAQRIVAFWVNCPVPEACPALSKIQKKGKTRPAWNVVQPSKDMPAGPDPGRGPHPAASNCIRWQFLGRSRTLVRSACRTRGPSSPPLPGLHAKAMLSY